MKIKFLMFCVLALFSIKNYSQEGNDSSQTEEDARTKLPTLIPPSPTVASLMKFEEVPIDYYSGQPNIAIPLFNKKISANLSIPIALKYSTSGIKINNRSSWVGTGWSLECGGVISRTVRGLPDELITGNKTGVLHNPNFWNYDNLPINSQQEFLWNAYGTSYYKYDNQLDLYQFSFLGITGRFVITDDLEAKLMTKDLNIKIDIDFNMATLEINRFILTDNNGNKFTFDVKELANNSQFFARHSFDNSQSSSDTPQLSVNAWHLSKVETSNDENLATFTYTEENELYTNSVFRTFYDVINKGGDWTSFIKKSYNSGVLKPKKAIVHNVTQVGTQKLSSITFRDNTSVNFSLATAIHPETAGKYLESITILENNIPPTTENKTFTFEYDTTIENQRLWLTKITESTPNQNAPVYDYHLEYIDKENLPIFDSESDDWGYNKNDYDTPSTNCNFVSFDKEAIKKGLLNRIIYPNGGVKEFAFEHNTISYNAGNAITSDEYLELNPENWLPQNVNATFHSSNSTIESFSIPYSQNVVYNQLSVIIHDYGIGNNTEEEILFNSAIKITNLVDGSIINIRLDKLNSHFTLEQGDYEIELAPILTLGVVLSTNICLSYKDYKDQGVEEFIYGGGVRIKEVMFKDDATTIENERKITYSYDDETVSGFSSGATDGNFGRIVKKYNFNQTRKFMTNFNDTEESGGELYIKLINYSVVSKDSYLGLTKGKYVGYKSVVVNEEDKKDKFIFTSPQDYSSPNNVYNYPFLPAPNIDFKRGLLLKSISLKLKTNGEYKKIREKENQYIYENQEIAKTFVILDTITSENAYSKQFFDSYVNYSISVPDVEPQCVFFNPPPLSTPYFDDCYSESYVLLPVGVVFPFNKIDDNVQSGWAKLNETLVKDYFYDSNDNQNIVETRQTFNYDPDNFRITEKATFFTDNSYVQTNIFYPHTVSSSLFTSQEYVDITKLTNLNKINEVVYSQKIKNGVQIGASLVKYKEYLTNQVFPNNIQTSIGVEDLEDRITYHNYDSYGNPIELSKANGIHIVYIWGYNHTQSIAKIVNATYSEVETILGTGFVINEYFSSSQETSLRNGLPNAQITTIDYIPLIGVNKIIDQDGNVQTYHYDDFNRLKFVKDAQNNILSKNEYHYRSQN